MTTPRLSAAEAVQGLVAAVETLVDACDHGADVETMGSALGGCRRALAAFREQASTEDSIARYFLLNGKHWRDPDGPTIVDGVDADEGMRYPVKYHWESGGHGANSVRGFLRENHLPMEEVVRLVAAILGPITEQGEGPP